VLKKVLIYFLAFLLLVANGGFVVIHHTCNLSHSSNTAIFTDGDCCDKESKSSCCASKHTQKQSDCCTVDVTLLKGFEPTETGTQFNPQLLQTVFVSLNIFSVQTACPSKSVGTLPITSTLNASPPLSFLKTYRC